MKRRDFLAGASSLALLACMPAEARIRGGAAPALSMDLNVRLTMQGGTTRVNASDGRDLGDWPLPGGRKQKNIMCLADGFAQGCNVFFRHDSDFSRIYVRLELSDVGDLDAIAAGTATYPTAYRLGAFTYQVFDGDTPLSPIISVPFLDWCAAIPWENKPRAIANRPDDLKAARKVWPYGLKGVPGKPDPIDNSDGRYNWTGPMSLAGIGPDWPGTGERQELGVRYDIDVNWLINQTSEAEALMRNWAKGALACPLFFRNRKTGGLVKMTDYFRFMQQYTPRTKQVVALDNAHSPPLGITMYQAGGDLDDFETVYGMIPQQYGGGWPQDDGTLLAYAGQERGVAWAMRNLVHLVMATQQAESYGAIPSYLTNQSEARKLLQWEIDWFTNTYINSTLPFTKFGWGPRISDGEPYQLLGYLTTTLACAVWCGFEDLRPMLEYNKRAVIGLCGTMPAYPCPYYFNISTDLPGAVYDPRLVKASDFQPDYPTAWDVWAKADIAAHPNGDGQITQAGYDALKKDPTNGGVLVQGNIEFAMHGWAACAVLTRLGYKDAEACYRMVAPIIKRYQGGRGFAQWRYAFESGLPGEDVGVTLPYVGLVPIP